MGEARIKKKKQDRVKLPDLPIVGNQRKWNIIKVVLRVFCLLLSIIDVAELVAIDTAGRSLDYRSSIAYPVLAVFILWDVIEFVVIIARKNISKGIHPGAHVGVELILWLGGAATVVSQALQADWYELTRVEWYLNEVGISTWAQVALTQLSFLGLLALLRFILFVRACVELDRRKKDRRLQQLVFAIQEQGRDPQDIPLSAFRKARGQNHVGTSTVSKAISHSTMRSSPTAESSTTLQRPSAEDRDFAYKYNFPIVTVPELLDSGIHPEDARNQKVLIGTFPR